MVINLLLECAMTTVNDMIRIFFKSKWVSWHCHVKKTQTGACVAIRMPERQVCKSWKIKHRVWITITWKLLQTDRAAIYWARWRHQDANQKLHAQSNRPRYATVVMANLAKYW